MCFVVNCLILRPGLLCLADGHFDEAKDDSVESTVSSGTPLQATSMNLGRLLYGLLGCDISLLAYTRTSQQFCTLLAKPMPDFTRSFSLFHGKELGLFVRSVELGDYKLNVCVRVSSYVASTARVTLLLSPGTGCHLAAGRCMCPWRPRHLAVHNCTLAHRLCYRDISVGREARAWCHVFERRRGPRMGWEMTRWCLDDVSGELGKGSSAMHGEISS